MYGCKCNLRVPDTELKLTPGCKVKLGRFDTVVWRLEYGWFTWGGNRPFCGWYLVEVENPKSLKPLQKTDLCDIYLIEH